MASLKDLVKPYNSISIIGMCKNAGKTTVLNRLLRELSQEGQTLALSSIGRDGEDKDLVTGTRKPGIFIREGTLAATASELLLRHCDVTREILDTTGVPTPMGEVVIFRGKSDGFVQLAGPSITAQLAALREDFFRLGADKVIFDGALSRKSLCSRQVTEATVLCTGASYSRSMETVLQDTAYQVRLLTLPETKEQTLKALSGSPLRDTLFLEEGGLWTVPGGVSLEDALRSRQDKGVKAVFFGGALSDFSLKPLLMSNAPIKGLTFVVRDSSKLLLKQDSYEKLTRRGIALEVLDSVNLAAVTVNPFSAYGVHFPKEEFAQRMQALVQLPVIDVMEDSL